MTVERNRCRSSTDKPVADAAGNGFQIVRRRKRKGDLSILASSFKSKGKALK